MQKIEIAVFSGGRGTRSIQEAFAGVDNVRVSYLINGYDSGLSTGEVRRVIDGMLGPSDFRKALTGISQSYQTSSARDLSKLFEFRLPVALEQAQAEFAQWSTVESATGYIARLVPTLPIEKALAVADEMTRFTTHVAQHPEANFDCSDLAIGNAYFGGAYLRTGSFNSALDDAKTLFELPDSVDILNVTEGDDLWLAVTTQQPLCALRKDISLTSHLQHRLTKLCCSIGTPSMSFGTPTVSGHRSRPNSLRRSSNALRHHNRTRSH